MKKNSVTASAAIVTGVFLLAMGALQSQNAPNNQPAANNQPAGKQIIEDLRLNNFETSEDWRAFSTTPLGETKARKTIQVGPIKDIFNPNEITEEEKKKFTEGQNHVLGIKTFFKDRGFDRVEVKPPHEYVIKGIGREISIWALGRNFRHTLYVKLRDYKGNVHKLRLGRLDYFGWKKHVLTIPGWLPQSTRYSLQDKNLHFVSLFVESDVHEVGREFYFYVDELRVRADRSDMDYPGSQIKDTW